MRMGPGTQQTPSECSGSLGLYDLHWWQRSRVQWRGIGPRPAFFGQIYFDFALGSCMTLLCLKAYITN